MFCINPNLTNVNELGFKNMSNNEVSLISQITLGRPQTRAIAAMLKAIKMLNVDMASLNFPDIFSSFRETRVSNDTARAAMLRIIIAHFYLCVM